MYPLSSEAQNASDPLEDPLYDQAVQHRIGASRSQGGIHIVRQSADPCLHQLLKPRPDHIKSQIEHTSHDQDKEGKRRPFSGQDTVDLLRPDPLFALARFDHAFLADLFNEGKAHIRNRRAPVQAALTFHLQRDMLQRLQLVLIQLELFQDHRIPLHHLRCGKPERKACHHSMVLNEALHSVKAPVNGSSVFIRQTIILSCRLLPVFCDVNRMIDQLRHAFIFRR